METCTLASSISSRWGHQDKSFNEEADNRSICRKWSRSMHYTLLGIVPNVGICLFAYTGIRLGEAVTLRWADVRPERLTVRGKGTKYRNVPLTENFWDSISEYMEWRRTVEDPFFLIHPRSNAHPQGPYTSDGLAEVVRQHSKKMGVKFSSHTFRRSFGRHLYKAGMPLPEIQRLYGHASVEMTIRYIGIRDDDLSESLSRFQPRY